MKKFIRKYIRPFWFSDDCDVIKVPYVYGTIVMTLFSASIIVFLKMALSKQFGAPVLGTVAGVIATLAGLYFGIIKLYNSGKDKAKKGKSNGEI